MLSDNNISRLRDEIKNCFATARHEEGVKRLIDFTGNHKPDMEMEAIIVSSDLYELLTEMRTGTIEPEKGKLNKRQIIFRALTILDMAWKNTELQITNAGA